MTVCAPSTHDPTHWYHRDGSRCSEVIGKTTGTPRKPTIRDARELGLLPGVTGICKLYPNDSLQRWKRSQDILAAITTPRFANETDDFYISRILAAADEECRAAADVGTRRHAIVEQFHRRTIYPDDTMAFGDDLPFIQPYLKWFDGEIMAALGVEYQVGNIEYGYAGTIDLYAGLRGGDRTVVDLKNRKNIATYETDAMQLAAYRRAVGADVAISVVLGTEKPEILVKEWSAAEDQSAWNNFELCLKLWKSANAYSPELWEPEKE